MKASACNRATKWAAGFKDKLKFYVLPPFSKDKTREITSPDQLINPKAMFETPIQVIPETIKLTITLLRVLFFLKRNDIW